MQPASAAATGSRNTPQPAQLVSGARAARELSLNKSTLTRYLRTYPELNRSAVDGKILVDLAELKRHRDENVNLVKSGNHAGRLFEEEAQTSSPPLLPEAFDEPAAEATRQGAYATARARFEEIRARRAEREEAEHLGQLVSGEAVAEAIGEALIVLRDKLLSPDLDLCEAVAKTSDPAEVMKVLRAANRAALEKLTEAFREHAGRGGAS